MNKMLGYLKDYKRESVLAPLFKMLEATFDLFVPLVMADIVNIGIAAHDFHYILVRCGILLLLAQVQVGMRQRYQELVVWRTLGAGKSLLRTTLWAEFALLGVVSGIVAAIGAEVALAMLQTKVFDFPWSPDWRLWVMLPLCGALLLSLCGGWLGLRLLKGKALFRQFSQ